MFLKKLSKIYILMPAALLLLSGCFNFPYQARSIPGAAANGDSIYDLTPITLAPGPAQKTVQVLDFRAVANTYTGLTGTALTDLITGDPNVTNDMSTYSLDNSADSITSPMLLNQVRLAAGLCLALVKKEKVMAASSRKFFNLMNFAASSTSQNFSAALQDAANRISNVFCGEAAQVADQNTVVSEITNALPVDTTGNITDTSSGGYYQNVVDGATMTCTAYLSSACTLVNN